MHHHDAQLPSVPPSILPASSPHFTLIELLVVITIIVILLGILVPSLSTARRTARLAVCSSNLKQLATATRTYADTNDGYLPRRGQGVGITTQIDRPTDWFNALPLIMGQRSYFDLASTHQVPRPLDHNVLSCPEALDTGNPNFWSYGMNMWLSVWNNGLLDNPDKFNAVGEPATLVLLADGPPDHCSVSPATAPQYPYSPLARHAGRVNIAFLDGHVDSFTAAYIGCDVGFVEHPEVQWRVPNSAWNSAQH